MNKKLISIIFLSIFALTNCTNSSNQNILSDNTITQHISTQNSTIKIENMVNKHNMIKNLSVFAGEEAFDGNKKINERGTDTGRKLTKEFLKFALSKMDYKVEELNYSSGFFYKGSNIMTKLMATEPTDEYILVGAHMDSVKNPGADDNASGSTAILEAATILKDMPVRKVNIMFAWFDQEELGLIGSKAMASELKKQNINLTSAHIIDMMGWDQDGDRTIEIARPGGFLWDYYKMVNTTHNLNLPLFRTSLDRSDHYSFERNGYNSLLLIEEFVNKDFNENYHQKTDTLDKINFDYLVLGTKLLVAAVSDLALKVPAPKNIKVISHDNFPTRKGFCGDVDETDAEHFHH